MSSFLRAITFTARSCRGLKHIQATNSVLNSAVSRIAQPARFFAHAAPRVVTQTPGRQGIRPQVVDKALFKLDSDVRRTGRISFKEMDNIINMAQKLETLTPNQTLLLLRATGGFLREEPGSVRDTLTDKVWSMTEKGSLDVSHYNALLQVRLENGTEFNPADFLKMMKENNITPNRVTYQRLISRYCDIGDIDGASKILEFMKAEDMAISERVFNSLIAGHLKAGDKESAKKMFEVMSNAQLPPTSESYTVFACGIASPNTPVSEILSTIEGQALSDEQILRIVKSMAVAGITDLEPVLAKLPKGMGYTQDLVNITLELIVLGKREAAETLFNLLPHDPEKKRTSGNFFISQLVKVGTPKSDVTRFCSALKAKGHNDFGIRKATETALMYLDRDSAIEYLKEFKAEEGYLRAHFFNPLIVKAQKDSEVMEILKIMRELESPATYDTMIDFVYNKINTEDPDAVLASLVDSGYTVYHTVNSLVNHMLSTTGDLEKVMKFCEKHEINFDPFYIVQPLGQATRNAGQAKLSVEILSKVLNSGLTSAHRRQDWVGKYLNNVDDLAFDECVKYVAEHGLNISRQSYNNLVNAKKNVAALENYVVDYREENEVSPRQSEMTLDELEGHLIELENKKMNTRGVLRKLLMQYCRVKDAKKAEETLAKLENEKFSGAMMAQLCDLFTSTGDLDKALSYFESCSAIKDFHIDDHKVINLVTLFIKNKKFDQGVALLDTHYAKMGVKGKGDQLFRNVARMVEATVEEESIDKAEQLIKKVVDEYQYTTLNAHILSSIMRHHFDNNAIDKALKLYEDCAINYKFTPWKRDLSIKFIQANDKANLDKVTELSQPIHGDANTEADLASYYIEAGKVEEARQIISTLNVRSRQRLETIAETFADRGLKKELEVMIDVTRDVAEFRRETLFYQLIRCHGKEDDADAALDVWTRAQEDNVVLSSRTLRFLASMLQHAGKEIPFVIPPSEFERVTLTKEKSPVKVKLNSGDIDGALLYRTSTLEAGHSLSVDDESSIINALMAKDDYDGAYAITKEMLSNKTKPSHPYPNTLRVLLSRLARQGSIEQIEDLRPLFHEDLLRTTSFDNVLCSAYVFSGRAAEFLNKLENQDPAESVPLGGLKAILENCPDLNKRVETFARRCAQDANNVGPINMVWIRHFLNGDYEAADAILNEFPKLKEKLVFNNIISQAREKQDEVMSEKLVKILWDHSHERVRGIGCSAHLDVLISNKKLNEAEGFLNDIQKKGVNLQDLNLRSLENMRKEFTLAGREPPFQMPEKKEAISN